ncbi:acetoin utilization protein [Metallosphaera sedula]|uniref:Acetoin utilization protein n=1 Tax=Metallosphaera sedula TaxID=43687 RepID=A0A0K1SQA5_9CREN|nr:histone deacetylase [Metallosphaera sedula]AKV74551.1 acetoin utilization protein [Metallosphaera sedula]AKV76790.1 acetoin utilization protein [Metallosphaera sedula]AKV79041.1 acetoin utilization protein [Metallosphaera sedula]AKV81286.1 acetoin utilization protein [Metallosphaera sedula]AKV83524.1 acetoin utilization protein [Metallosphaera sedula]
MTLRRETKLTYGDSLGIVWDERFREISFSHPMIRDVSKSRIVRFRELVSTLNVYFISPKPATYEDLLEVHDESLLRKIKEVSSLPYIGFLDSGDTVHYPGMFDDILLVAGSTLTAIFMSRFFDSIYIPLGGFHHATRSRSMGFCPINDVNLAISRLMKMGERVALVDVDAHHANGVEEMFYDKPVLKINIFAYDGKFFPGTGDYRRRGKGEGTGYNFNVGLPLGSADDSFQEALRLLDVVEDFKPSVLLVVAGVDGHKDDGLKSLNLTTNSFNLLGLKVSRLARRVNARIISFGGGGYGPGSAPSMFSFVKGLMGNRSEDEMPTQDEEKKAYVKKLVDLLLERLPSSLE